MKFAEKEIYNEVTIMPNVRHTSWPPSRDSIAQARLEPATAKIPDFLKLENVKENYVHTWGTAFKYSTSSSAWCTSKIERTAGL